MSVIDSLLIEIGVDASQVEKGINESRQSVFAMGDFIKKWWRDNVDKALSDTGKNLPKEIKLPEVKPATKQPQPPEEPKKTTTPDQASTEKIEVETPEVKAEPPKKQQKTPEPPEDKEPKESVFGELKKALQGLREAFSVTKEKPKEVEKTPVKPTKREKMIEPEAPRREDYNSPKEYDKAFKRHDKESKRIREYNRKVDEDYNKAFAEYKDKTDEITRAKKELNRAEKEHEDILGRLTSRLKDVAAGYLTISSLAKQGSKLADLRDAAKAARVDPKEMDAWKRAFRAAGYEAEAARDTIQKIQDGIRDVAVKGESRIIGGMRAIIGDESKMRDENGKFKKYDELFAEYVKALREKDEGFARSMAKDAGFDDEAINLMLDKSVDIEKLIEKHKQLAASKELTESSKAFVSSWNELMDAFSSFGNVVLKYVLPPITWAVKALTSLIQTIAQSDVAVAISTAVIGAFALKFTFLGKVISGIIGFIAKFGGKIGSLGGILSGFGGWIKSAIGALGGLGSKLLGLLPSLSSLGGLFKTVGTKGGSFLELGLNALKLNPFIAKITAIGLGLRELYKFFTDGDSVIDWFLQKMGFAADSIKSFKETWSWHPDKVDAADDQTDSEKHAEKWDNAGMFDEIEHPTVPQVSSNFYGNRSVTINNETNIQGNVAKPEEVARMVNRANENHSRNTAYLVADMGVSA